MILKGVAMSEKASKALSREELEFYSRQIVLGEIGYEGQLKLRDARVCVVGLGGLGSPASLQLAAMGIGNLRLLDYDVVELSNLQRQHLYDTNLVGYPKVEAAARRLGGLNPHIDIEPLPLSLNERNAQRVLGDVDVVVDGLDRMSPRYALNRACVKLGIPYVFGSAIQTFGNVTTVIPGETPCLECFQGNFEDDDLPTCAVVGVHPSIISVIASIQVSEATKVILGERPRLASKLLYCSLNYLEFEEVNIAPADSCPVCGSRPIDPVTPLKWNLVTELCARDGKRTFVITPREELALDMDQLSSLLSSKGFEIRVKSVLGTTFDDGLKGAASLLKSGIMIIQDAVDQEEAYDLFRELVIEGLNTPRTSIEGDAE
jgi:adenylyltransferase/sulfurtransferase